MRHKRKKTILRDDEDDDNDEDAGSNDYFTTLPKRSKPAARKQQHKKRKATINPDLVFGAVDPGANNENEARVDEDPATTVYPKRYTMKKSADWTRRENREGRVIKPVPYTSPSELFDIKLEDGDLGKMKGAHGTIQTEQSDFIWCSIGCSPNLARGWTKLASTNSSWQKCKTT